MAMILVFGVAAYFMEENGDPIAPAILGVILGAMLEEHFVTSMIKADGRFLAFFERLIAAGLGALTLLVWLWPRARRWSTRRRAVA